MANHNDTAGITVVRSLRPETGIIRSTISHTDRRVVFSVLLSKEFELLPYG